MSATSPSQVVSQAQQAVGQAKPFIAKLARAGYAAKGLIYTVVGGLAAGAVGAGGETTGSRGALQTMLEQPFGRVVLGLVAVGLIGYALFQFVRAVEDPEHEGTDGKAMLKRAGFFLSGLIHVSLCVAAARLLMGSGGGGGDDAGAKSYTATAMTYPLGRWAVGLVGAGVIAFGLFQIVKAWRAKLDDQLVLTDMSDATRTWVRRICRFGMAARGVVFGIIGTLLIVAAWRFDPAEAKGLGGALAALERQPFGPWLLGLVALGLIAYGIYQFVLSRYRRIPT